MSTTLRNKLTAVREQVREAYRNGATLRQIAELHNVSQGTIRGLLLDMGETLRTRGRRRKEDMHDPRILSALGFKDDTTEVDEPRVETVVETEIYEGGAF